MKDRLGCLVAICWCALLLTSPAAAQSVEWQRLNQEATTLFQQGNYDQAVGVAKKALGIAERDLGPNHPDVATSPQNISALYTKTGKTDEARKLSDRAAKIRELKR